MKKFYWLGAPLAVAAAALAFWLASPNALSAIWVQHFPAAKLSAASKSKAATAFHCVAPSVPLADVERFACNWKIPKVKQPDGTEIDGPRELHCVGAGVQTLTADRYVIELAAGTVGPYASRTGDTVVVPAHTADILVTADCLDEWQVFTDAVWPGNWNTLVSWFCARNPANAAQVDCETDNAKSGTSTEYLDAGGGTDGGPALRGVVQ